MVLRAVAGDMVAGSLAARRFLRREAGGAGRALDVVGLVRCFGSPVVSVPHPELMWRRTGAAAQGDQAAYVEWRERDNIKELFYLAE